MLILSDAEVAAALDMRETLDALERAFAASARQETISSPWMQLFVDSAAPRPAGVELAGCQMRTASGYAPGANVIAVRLSADILHVGRINGSVRRDTVPAAHGKWVGLVMLFSVETGEPLALFPDAYLQHFRVGATNGLGTKYLSRKDARRVGLLGAGWQAEARLQAYCEVRTIERVQVYSPRRESREDFARRMSAMLELPVVAVDSADAAVADADIIAAATSSIEPVIDERWIRPGVHIDCVRELEFTRGAIERATVAAYNRRDPVEAQVITCRTGRRTTFSAGTEGGYAEVNDRTGWWNDVGVWNAMTTLEELVAGEQPGRRSEADVTLFLSRGVAQQFSAVGAVVLENARRLRIGREIEPDLVLQDRPT